AVVTVTPPEVPSEQLMLCQITKTESPGPHYPGDEVTYTLTVTNSHPRLTATDVTLTDTLPEGAQLVRTSPASTTKTVDATTAVVFSLGDIPSGESRSVTITVRYPKQGTYINGRAANLCIADGHDGTYRP